MKRITHIGSLPLAIYFIVLPLLIGLHKLHHDSHSHRTHGHTEAVFQATDCELCELYESQAGLLELPLVFENLALFTPVQELKPEQVPFISTAYISLRGPPKG